MKITEKRKIGNLGEAIAAKYLKSRGFIVLKRNYLLSYGEVDVIAQSAGVIHFVEVKSVTCEINDSAVSHEIGWNPAERVTEAKLTRVGKAAQTYLAQVGLSDAPWQIDIALVYIDSTRKNAKVELLENQAPGT